MVRVHTDHTKKTDSFSQLTKKEEEANLSERDKQRAYMLLSLIKKKVKYKQKDLFQELKKHRLEEFSEEAIGDVEEQERNEFYFTGEWAFVFENSDLIEALESLSYRNQEILWLLFVEMKSQKEVAKKLQVSPASISQAKKRSYRQIHSLLEKNRGD